MSTSFAQIIYTDLSSRALPISNDNKATTTESPGYGADAKHVVPGACSLLTFLLQTATQIPVRSL